MRGRIGVGRRAKRGRSLRVAWAALACICGSLVPALATSEHDCVIEPDQTVRLASPVVGVISRVDVDRGDTVRKGQILAQVDDRVEVATLALAREKAANDASIKSAEARLLFLRRKLERFTQLQLRSIKSVSDLQEAEAEVLVAEQLLREAQVNRQLARLEMERAEEVVKQRALVSPIDGVVVERQLVPGEYRNEQTHVLILARIDQLRVEVIVPTARYGEIKVGSKAEVRAEPPIGGVHAATVTVVDRVLDAASGTFGVRLALPNPDLALPSGIRCRITFAVPDARSPSSNVGTPVAGERRARE